MYLLKKILTNFKIALSGLKSCFILDKTFRLEIFLTPIIFLFIYIFFKKTEMMILIFLWMLILSGELFNTAIEKTLDLINREQSIKIKQIKDISSSAVFILVILFISISSFFLLS